MARSGAWRQVGDSHYGGSLLVLQTLGGTKGLMSDIAHLGYALVRYLLSSSPSAALRRSFHMHSSNIKLTLIHIQ